MRRRAFEYDHEYGFTLLGQAVRHRRTVDGRSQFVESFHTLLHRCYLFFKEDDDTTVIADGFPLLNALRETHLILAEGAHNQFGDLPSTARAEMLIMQWLLARPEMRDFLGGRVMVPYEEDWMDRVDTMKQIQGWTDVSITHFRDMGVFGEQLLLSHPVRQLERRQRPAAGGELGALLAPGDPALHPCLPRGDRCRPHRAGRRDAAGSVAVGRLRARPQDGPLSARQVARWRTSRRRSTCGMRHPSDELPGLGAR